MRRQIPYLLLAVLTLWAGVFALISWKQSTDSSSLRMVVPCTTQVLGAKPTTYILSCADANSEFTNLHWFDWGSETAYATGVARWNDCTPTCVAGHWRTEPVTVWAWDPRHEIYTKVSSSDPRLLGTVVISGRLRSGVLAS